MDRAHFFYAVLLNVFSVQLTFCGTGEPYMFLSPSNFEMRSMAAQPFIQAQFHPASGTIQQGIMLPQEHLMPQERIPEELYYEERMVPQGSTVHQQRMGPPERMMPEEVRRSSGRMIPAAEEPMIPSQQHFAPHERMMQQSIDSQVSVMPQEITVPQERAPQLDMEPQDRMVPQENVQKILHSSPAHPHSPQTQEEIAKHHAQTHQGQLLEADLRAVKTGYEYSHPRPYQAPSYGYNSPTPSYNAPAPSAPSYTHPTPSYSAPAVHTEPVDKFLLKPDLTELVKPVTGKMAGKLSGLLSLLSLFGSGKGMELTGIKDLLIDGILKPLLVAKGGIKALISKLSIPIVALILINLEVLITVWWLWEDCPAIKHEVEYTKPSYPATPPSYNYR